MTSRMRCHRQVLRELSSPAAAAADDRDGNDENGATLCDLIHALAQVGREQRDMSSLPFNRTEKDHLRSYSPPTRTVKTDAPACA